MTGQALGTPLERGATRARKYVMVSMGTSISNVVNEGVLWNLMWPELTAAKLRASGALVKMRSIGSAGAVSGGYSGSGVGADLISRLPLAVLREIPDLVILEIGVNDWAHGIPFNYTTTVRSGGVTPSTPNDTTHINVPLGEGNNFIGNGATATAVLTLGAVSSVANLVGGANYSGTNLPNVQVLGGGGAGAILVPTVGGGAVTALTPTPGGAAYTVPPIVQVSGYQGMTMIVNLPGGGQTTAVVTSVTKSTNGGTTDTLVLSVALPNALAAGSTLGVGLQQNIQYAINYLKAQGVQRVVVMTTQYQNYSTAFTAGSGRDTLAVPHELYRNVRLAQTAAAASFTDGSVLLFDLYNAMRNRIGVTMTYPGSQEPGSVTKVQTQYTPVDSPASVGPWHPADGNQHLTQIGNEVVALDLVTSLGTRADWIASLSI